MGARGGLGEASQALPCGYIGSVIGQSQEPGDGKAGQLMGMAGSARQGTQSTVLRGRGAQGTCPPGPGSLGVRRVSRQGTET